MPTIEKAIPIASIVCFLLAVLTAGLRLPWMILMVFSIVMAVVGILVIVNYRQLAQRIGKDFIGQQPRHKPGLDTNQLSAHYISVGRWLGLVVTLLALVCTGFAFGTNEQLELRQLGGNIILSVSLIGFISIVIPTIIRWFKK